jgi:ESCRT-I complex subunit VPS37
MQTPLTHEFPSTSTLNRSDLLNLIGAWDASRPSAPWYQQQQQSSSSASAPPLEEQAFEAFIESLSEVRLMRQETEKLIRESEEKAGEIVTRPAGWECATFFLPDLFFFLPLPTARNMALQPPLEKLRVETQQLYDRARSLEQQWPRVDAEMKDVYKRFTPFSLLSTLTQSASRLHDESESLANAFVEGLPLEIAVSRALGLGEWIHKST